MIIKAGSITNLTDARFFASYAVDYIGFCFDPLSPNYISPQQALAIKGWIHGAKIVAEFANQDPDNVKNIIQFVGPDVIEMQSSEFGVQSSKFKVGSFGVELPVIMKSSVHDLHHILAGDYLFVLIDDYNGEDISQFNFPIMIDSTNKQIDFSNPKISAVQFKGSPENEVGVKDYNTLSEILEKITEGLI